jgi:hypothetical protein
MNSKALAVVLVLVSVLSIATWFVHGQISDLPAQNSELKETKKRP